MDDELRGTLNALHHIIAQFPYQAVENARAKLPSRPENNCTTTTLRLRPAVWSGKNIRTLRVRPTGNVEFLVTVMIEILSGANDLRPPNGRGRPASLAGAHLRAVHGHRPGSVAQQGKLTHLQVVGGLSGA